MGVGTGCQWGSTSIRQFRHGQHYLDPYYNHVKSVLKPCAVDCYTPGMAMMIALATWHHAASIMPGYHQFRYNCRITIASTKSPGQSRYLCQWGSLVLVVISAHSPDVLIEGARQICAWYSRLR